VVDRSRLRAEGTLFGDDAGEYSRPQHQVRELRIELGAASRGKNVRRRVHAFARSITTTVCYRVECVGERDDASGEWNAASAKSGRIAGTIPAFVVRENSFGQIRIKRRDRRQYLGAALRVRRDRTAFGGREMRVLMDDVEERLVDFPDIVKEGDSLDDLPSVDI